MKKQYFLVAVAVMIAVLTVCSNQNVNDEVANVSLTKPISSLAGNTECTTVLESVTALESTTEWYEPTTQKTTEPSTTEKASTTAKQTIKKQSTTAKPTTTKAATTSTTKRVTTTHKPTTTHKEATTKKATTTKKSRCTNKDNHSMMCGNMGKWYNSRSELKADYMRVSDYWLAKLDNEEIDWDTYMKNCPQGYECWSCADCGKWTGNYN